MLPLLLHLPSFTVIAVAVTSSFMSSTPAPLLFNNWKGKFRPITQSGWWFRLDNNTESDRLLLFYVPWFSSETLALYKSFYLLNSLIYFLFRYSLMFCLVSVGFERTCARVKEYRIGLHVPHAEFTWISDNSTTKMCRKKMRAMGVIVALLA